MIFTKKIFHLTAKKSVLPCAQSPSKVDEKYQGVQCVQCKGFNKLFFVKSISIKISCNSNIPITEYNKMKPHHSTQKANEVLLRNKIAGK